MPQTINEQENSFGKRLALLRKQRGFTQTQLAVKIGVTRRTIAYYEKESPNLPGNLLLELAKALETSLEELLSGEPNISNRFSGFIQDIEKLPKQAQEELISVVESYLEQARAD
tara:strand:- start:71 stop:412 length:342 start_codon:yes stop_codon:yes gene_type:complete